MLSEDRDAVRQMKAELESLALRLDSGDACATSYRSRMAHYHTVYTAATRSTYDITSSTSAHAAAAAAGATAAVTEAATPSAADASDGVAAAAAGAAAVVCAAGYDVGELLYMDYQEVLVHYLARHEQHHEQMQAQPEQPQRQRAADEGDGADKDAAVFARVLRVWQNYQVLTRWCMQAFSYLSRYYIVQHNKPSLQSVAVHLFWQHVLQPHVDVVARVTQRLLLREQAEDNGIARTAEHRDDGGEQHKKTDADAAHAVAEGGCSNKATSDTSERTTATVPHTTTARQTRRQQIATAIQLLCAVSNDATRFSYSDRVFSPLLVAVAEAYEQAVQQWSVTLDAHTYVQRLLDAIGRERTRCLGYFASTSDAAALVECVEDAVLRSRVTYDKLLLPSDDGIVAALHARDTHALVAYDALFARRPWGVARLADALRTAIRAEGYALAHRLADDKMGSSSSSSSGGSSDGSANADADTLATASATSVQATQQQQQQPAPLLQRQLCVCVRALMDLQSTYAQLVTQCMRNDATLARAVRESIERVYSGGVYMRSSSSGSSSKTTMPLQRVRFSELLAFYLDAVMQRVEYANSGGDNKSSSGGGGSAHPRRDTGDAHESAPHGDVDSDATPPLLLQRCGGGNSRSDSSRSSNDGSDSEPGHGHEDDGHNDHHNADKNNKDVEGDGDDDEDTCDAATLRAALHRVLTALDYVADRDCFFATSRDLMAQRILYPRRPFRVAREDVMTHHMRRRCGVDATAPLEGLLHDVTAARDYDVAAALRTYAAANTTRNEAGDEAACADVTLPCAMTLLVGKKGLWPPAVTQPRGGAAALVVSPPPCVRDVLQVLQRAYLVGTRDRALVWAHEYSTAELAMTTPAATHSRPLMLHVSGLQATALLALDAAPAARMTIAALTSCCCSAGGEDTVDVATVAADGGGGGAEVHTSRDTATMDGDDAMYMALLPLVRSHVLSRTPARTAAATTAASSSVWRASDVLTINDGVTGAHDTLVLYPSFARLHLATVATDGGDGSDGGQAVLSAAAAAAAAVAGDDGGDAQQRRAREERRRAALDACIVKTMKTHHTLAHAALVRECAERLTTQFVVDARQVKQRVEELIRRGFLERSASSPQVYCYHA